MDDRHDGHTKSHTHQGHTHVVELEGWMPTCEHTNPAEVNPIKAFNFECSILVLTKEYIRYIYARITQNKYIHEECKYRTLHFNECLCELDNATPFPLVGALNPTLLLVLKSEIDKINFYDINKFKY